MGMVEKVARAICRAELPSEDKWKLCIPAAREAISEMWEFITPEMIEGMEEMYMPMGDMRAAWDGAFFAAMKEED
jgi:hypothetical protein